MDETLRIMTDALADFGASSKLNAEWAFVSILKEEGRKSADAFLAAHGEDVGRRSTAYSDVLLAEC
jgi:NTE family protein